MLEYRNIKGQYMTDKLIHMYTCACDFETQEQNPLNTFLYADAVKYITRQLDNKEINILRHARIILQIDVFARSEMLTLLADYAETESDKLDFVFTRETTEFYYVSATFYDWVKFVRFCDVQPVGGRDAICAWRYCLNAAYPDIFDHESITKHKIDTQTVSIVGATVVDNVSIQAERHTAHTVRLTSTVEAMVYLQNVNTGIAVSLVATDDINFVTYYVTATEQVWDEVLYKLKTVEMIEKQCILWQLYGVVKYSDILQCEVFKVENTNDSCVTCAEDTWTHVEKSSEVLTESEKIDSGVDFVQKYTEYNKCTDNITNENAENLYKYTTLNNLCTEELETVESVGETNDTLLLLDEDVPADTVFVTE